VENGKMATAASSPILHLIRQMVEDPRVRHLPDPELLQRFAAQHDEAAFHGLLRRHGAMVLDVCRTVLGCEADAEDAFQATFLVLARKAASVRKTASLGSWLHGVAYRTALKARAHFSTRQKHEARAPVRQAAEPADPSWREVRQALHEELNELPEHYRAPLVMCYLEGATQDMAAAQFGVAKRTLRERLERGRELLRTRLVRRGLGPTAVLVAAAWPSAQAAASVPISLMASTIKAANQFAAGQATAGLISAKVAALTEGVLRTMLFTKLKIATAVLLVAVAGLGAGGVLYETQAAETAKAQNHIERRTQNQANLEASSDQRLPTPRDRAGVTFRAFIEGNAFWTLTDVDTKNNTISMNWADRMSLAGLVVAADAKVLVDGKEGRLTDLKMGMWITPRMAAGKPLITMIVATTKEVDLYVLNAVNTENSTIIVRLGNFNVTLPVAKDAMIVIRDKESTLADLRTGMPISLKLEPVGDQMATTSIRAEQ
jgi:RNA polymerase sigma factor (sigma-70 family)